MTEAPSTGAPLQRAVAHRQSVPVTDPSVSPGMAA